jgi:chemotaxis methyl-accepting protein methylase
LLIEEDDYGSALSLDVTDQSVAPYMAAQRASYDSLRKKGIADYYFGHRVRGLVEQLGFDDLGHEGWGGLQRIGAPNVEIRRHDILKDELEEREFDLVHCRKVLHHLARAEDH